MRLFILRMPLVQLMTCNLSTDSALFLILFVEDHLETSVIQYSQILLSQF